VEIHTIFYTNTSPEEKWMDKWKTQADFHVLLKSCLEVACDLA